MTPDTKAGLLALLRRAYREHALTTNEVASALDVGLRTAERYRAADASAPKLETCKRLASYLVHLSYGDEVRALGINPDAVRGTLGRIAPEAVAVARRQEGTKEARQRYLRVYTLTAVLSEVYAAGTSLSKLEGIARRVMEGQEYEGYEEKAVGRWFEATREAERNAKTANAAGRKKN